jgi:hypothetical protein
VVQPAGQAFNLPGPSQSSVRDVRDYYGIDLNALEDERKVAIGTLKGASSAVPENEIAAVDSGYKDAMTRLVPILASGEDPKRAIENLIDPLRSTTKALTLEHRYQESKTVPPGLSWIEQRQYSDAMTRLVSESVLQKQVEDSRNIMQMLEAKSGGVPSPMAPAGGGSMKSSDAIVIMTNPSGQSVKVPQSQVARARQLGYR